MRPGLQFAAGWMAILFLAGGGYAAAPAITSFAPASGAPGDRIDIFGASFSGADTVMFNNAPASFVVVSPTQISALVPARALTGPLSVTTPGGTGFSRDSFVVAPLVDGFEPVRGPPGTQVTIIGENFTGATVVEFHTNRASFVVTAANQIQAVVPSGAVTGPVRVTTPAGTGQSSLNFSVTGNGPFITGFSPVAGGPGTLVVISGERFFEIAGVQFWSNRSATFTLTATDQITATVPAGAVPGPITVFSRNGTNTSADTFYATVGPHIFGFEPQIGLPGTQVTIDGINFSGVNSVKFGGTNAPVFQVTSTSQLIATVPAAAATGPITVASAAGASTSTNSFIVLGRKPFLHAFSPEIGTVGDVIRVTGENFTDATAVEFNGKPTSFQPTAPGELYALVPAGATNGPITVRNPAGAGVSSNTFRVIGPEPIVQDFSPAGGGPGTRVTVNGLNFARATNVLFGPIATTNFTVVAPTQLEAVVPSNALSGTITVHNRAGAGSSTNIFYVAPRLDRFTPATGAVGANVDLVGQNFQGTISVLFGGRSAIYQVLSATNIRATVPASAVTGPVSVQNPGGSASSSSVFTVTNAPPGPVHLRIARQSGSIRLSWPAAATNYGLESSVALGGTWAQETSVPVQVNSEFEVVLAPAGQTRFFRLRRK